MDHSKNKGSEEESDKIKREKLVKKRYSSVETNRLPKNVKNVVKNEMTNQTISIPPILDMDLLQPPSGPDNRPFYYGNPFVEKHIGVLNLRAESNEGPSRPQSSESLMLCMVDVPAFFTCRELINFVRPAAQDIALIKVVRDDTPNKYMVVIKFKNSEAAVSFFAQYNNIGFNSIEPEKCILYFVDSIEGIQETSVMGLIGDPTYGETPTCSVCLERMEENKVLVILCNHSFHAECISQWADTTCPICRYTQTPEIVPNQKCFECGKTSDLWMCLICGNVGCGRYAEAHAYKHYEKTSHIFTLQVGGKLVWDYAGDNYVHRLIENCTDGKLVEYDSGGAENEKEKEKISAVQLEYTCLLTSQLENQRIYYEERLRETEQRFSEHGWATQQKINGLESELKNLRKGNDELQEQLASMTTTKQQIERKQQSTQTKCQTLQKQLDEERQMCLLLRTDKETLGRQKDELERLRREEITALEDQLHDLMMHFETQAKVQENVENGALTRQELEQSSMEVRDTEKTTLKKGARKKGNKK